MFGETPLSFQPHFKKFPWISTWILVSVTTKISAWIPSTNHHHPRGFPMLFATFCPLFRHHRFLLMLYLYCLNSVESRISESECSSIFMAVWCIFDAYDLLAHHHPPLFLPQRTDDECWEHMTLTSRMWTQASIINPETRLNHWPQTSTKPLTTNHLWTTFLTTNHL